MGRTTVIDRDCAVRWVKRHLARNDFQRAAEVAKIILTSGPGSYPSFVCDRGVRRTSLAIETQKKAENLFDTNDPFFWATLLTSYGETLIYLGVAGEKSKSLLEHTITLLERVEPKDDFQTWLRARVLGRAYSNIGYLHRVHGRFSETLMNYQKALSWFDMGRVIDERLDTKKNLAYLYGLIGLHHPARSFINEVLDALKLAPQKYAAGLAYNVSGYVYAWQDYPADGVEHCKKALALFFELSDLRGQGMAHNALGFCYRKWGEQWKGERPTGPTPVTASEYFNKSREHLEKALKMTTEPERRWETFNELGSLFCDWGFLARRHRLGNLSPEQFYEQSISNQYAALQVAEDSGLQFQIFDSCDDLAQAYSDLGDLMIELGRFDEAEKAWQKADSFLRRIETSLSTFQVQKGIGFPKQPSGPGTTEWLMLGKACRQRGIWALKRMPYQEEQLSREESIQEVIRFFAIAAAYFQHFSENSQILSDTFVYFAKRLKETQISRGSAIEYIAKVEADYRLDRLESLRQQITLSLGA